VAPVEPARPDDALPGLLPPFDIQAAVARIGKPMLVRKLMLGFRDLYENAGQELREHIANGRAEDCERLGHSLKSVAAMLEARSLAEAASAVEIAFRSGETADLDWLIENLERALAPAIAAANSLDRKPEAPFEPSTELALL